MLDTVLFYFLSCFLPERLICVELYWPFLISEFQLTNRKYKETEERKGRWRMCSLGHQGLVTSLHEMMVLLGNLLYYICFLVTALFQLVFLWTFCIILGPPLSFLWSYMNPSLSVLPTRIITFLQLMYSIKSELFWIHKCILLQGYQIRYWGLYWG